MKVFKNIKRLSLIGPSVVTIGNFDGVHLGHQKILSTVQEKARKEGLPSVVLTFDPHPVKVLYPDRALKLLMPLDERLRLIETLGIDIAVVINFSREFAKTPAEEFVRDILVNKLNARHVVVGSGYRFGKAKTGDTSRLRRLGKKYGFGLTVVRPVRRFGHVVSSSNIRQLLGWGRVCDAFQMLGRPFYIEGKVVKGCGRGGPLLGVPTANIKTPYEMVPKEGVYAVKVLLRGRLYDGVANIGRNPTFQLQRPSYEVHILDFDKDILNEKIKVFFIDRLRAERRFPSVEALKEQIHRDITAARNLLNLVRVHINP
ncbi:MAG: bifunctional riboflavin kinase/FAD synthetase [Nitrospirae bacterium]|nr:MAG: bifunctional riboflavin kinase/FAD synthetase [Nitrospirota bacterium]